MLTVQQAAVASALPAGVLALLELVFDVATMTSTVVEMNYDVKKSPLGKLTADQIKRVYSCNCFSLLFLSLATFFAFRTCFITFLLF